jgi:hypothetical protein
VSINSYIVCLLIVIFEYLSGSGVKPSSDSVTVIRVRVRVQIRPVDASTVQLLDEDSICLAKCVKPSAIDITDDAAHDNKPPSAHEHKLREQSS